MISRGEKKKESEKCIGTEVAKRSAHKHVKSSFKCNDKIAESCSPGQDKSIQYLLYSLCRSKPYIQQERPSVQDSKFYPVLKPLQKDSL